MGLHINMAPYRMDRMKVECLKLRKTVDDAALPSWGINAAVTGQKVLMASRIQYRPMESRGLEVGLAHLYVLKAVGGNTETNNYPVTEEIRREVSILHKAVVGITRVVSKAVVRSLSGQDGWVFFL